jgi:hypothetical protein
LVVGSVTLGPTLYALHDWWTDGGGAEPATRTWFSALFRIGDAALLISLLGYVLYRQGRSMRSIGLTARVSDLGRALLIAFSPR